MHRNKLINKRLNKYVKISLLRYLIAMFGSLQNHCLVDKLIEANSFPKISIVSPSLFERYLK